VQNKQYMHAFIFIFRCLLARLSDIRRRRPATDVVVIVCGYTAMAVHADSRRTRPVSVRATVTREGDGGRTRRFSAALSYSVRKVARPESQVSRCSLSNTHAIDLSAKMNSWCHVTNCPVRPACIHCRTRSPVRRSGILWQIICVIRLLNSKVLSVS